MRSLGLGVGGHHLHPRRESIKSNRSSSEDVRDQDQDDTTIVEPEQGNVLSHIISQLRPGADLSRVTLPTFILEERSMLERITNFMAHPDTLLPMAKIDDPVQRFVAVVKFYLSGWHIKPPGVKKPLNPILGEIFTGYWEYQDNTYGYYISEQTSHHPPKSSYFFMAPDHGIRVDGCLRPRSKFLGNSAASMMEGISYLRFTNRTSKTKGGEKYIVTQPNMYARGILFGKMKYELGDHSYVRCPENGLSADLDFKVKGWVAGTYNAIGGTIKNDRTGETLYELSGFWNGEMFIKDNRTGQKKLLFDATHAKHVPPLARPIQEQTERESQRLWLKTVKAVHVMDHVVATEEKAKIEDRQREEAKRREETGEEWKAKLFRPVRAGAGGSEEGEDDLEWILNANIDGKEPKTLTQQILNVYPILPGQELAKPLTPSPDAQASKRSVTPVPQKKTGNQDLLGDNLIDLSSRPPSTAPPESIAGNPLHPTSHPQQISAGGQGTASSQNSAQPKPSVNLLDDENDLEEMNSKMSKMKFHGADLTDGGKPLRRADTETSEVDVFVDAHA